MRALIAAGMLIFALVAMPGWSQENVPLSRLTLDKGTIDAIYPEESRIVIDDMEYLLGEELVINGQEISSGAALQILREGQVLSNILVRQQGPASSFSLEGADIL